MPHDTKVEDGEDGILYAKESTLDGSIQSVRSLNGRVPASSFLRAHFTDKEGRSRNDRSPSHYIPTTDAALIQKLLQEETTLNGLSSEIQKIKEEIMDQDTRHKNSDKLLH